MKSSGCGAMHAHHAPCLAGGIAGFRQHGLDRPAGSATIIRGQDSAGTLRPVMLRLDNSVLCVWGRGLNHQRSRQCCHTQAHAAYSCVYGGEA